MSVTRYPSDGWTAQQLLDAFPGDCTGPATLGQGVWEGQEEGHRGRLYSLDDGDHRRPAKKRGTVIVTELIWEFFNAHGRGVVRKKGKKQRKL